MDAPALGLVLLDGPNVVDGPLDVKWFYHLYELTCFQLCVVQNVLHVHQKQIGGRSRYDIAFLHLLVNMLQLLQDLGVDVLPILLNELAEV